MITVDEFFNLWNGKGIDFDGYYGNQCMDLAERYNTDVVGAPRLGGNAIDVWTNFPKDFYDPIANTPDGVPKKGDLVIWNVGKYGHIAVFSSGDVNSFISFDQNWPVQVDAEGNGTGVCHFQPHANYANVVGWLRPKNLPQSDSILVVKADFENLVKKSTELDNIADKYSFDKSGNIDKSVFDKVSSLEKEKAQIQDSLDRCQTSLTKAISNTSGGSAQSTGTGSNNSPSGTSGGSTNVQPGTSGNSATGGHPGGDNSPGKRQKDTASLQKAEALFNLFIKKLFEWFR